MEYRDHFHKNKVKTVMLTLTHRCNLACTYCYETDKNAEQMSEETAFRIIEAEMNGNPNIDFIEFDLFGGEPFINFDLMKKIVSFLKSRKWNKKWVCFITTNGTLVHKNIQEWLIENRDCVVCCISLDGIAEMHNYNRSNSFDKIDLSFFQSMYPEQPAKMTVSPYTLRNLANGIIFLQEKGYIVAANLAYGIDWSDSENVLIFERELKKLIDYYLEHPHISICKILDLDISIIGKTVTDEYKMKKYCGAGTTMVAYDANGHSYPCQMFLPISVGVQKSSEALQISFSPEYNVNKLGKKCKECVAKRVCPTCLGMNFHETGNIYEKDENYCNLMKIQLKAISFLKYQQLNKGILCLSVEERYALMKAIYLIQNEL